VLIGATTQNPSFEVIPPLLSRTRVLTLKPLDHEALKKILLRAISNKERGLGIYQINIEDDALDLLAHLAEGDARVALNNLEAMVYHQGQLKQDSTVNLGIEDVQKVLQKKALIYDKTEAGEDPLFICRRMIRFASEDIGLADPQALQVALAAFEAWEKVGPPEAELALAEAAAYLATAPKSNALYVAEKAVKEEIQRSGARPVPLHIRNAPTALMKKLGYGKGYLYPHNYPDAKVDQEYLPDGLKRTTFYYPTGRGFEREIRRRMKDVMPPTPPDRKP